MARFSDRLVSANKLIIAAAVIYAGSLTFAHADGLTSAQIDALPCAGSPSGHTEAELFRLAFVSTGLSLEDAVLGRSDAAAEAHAKAADDTASARFIEAVSRGDATAAGGALCAMKSIQADELARQLSTETPDEQARIAAYALQLKAKTHELVQQLPAAKAIEPAKASPAPGATPVQAYLSQVSAEVRSRLSYPPVARARGAKRVVGVSFTIGPFGAVTTFAIIRSSGDHDLDAAARFLVQGASFPPPPGGSAHISTSFNYSPTTAAAK